MRLMLSDILFIAEEVFKAFEETSKANPILDDSLKLVHQIVKN